MKTIIKSFTGIQNKENLDLGLRLLKICTLLYLFLIGVKTLSGGFKLMGSEFAQTLFNISDQPIVSLMSGMLATVLFQSSSVTSAIIVGLVSAGTIPIAGAVPMIMGANLGTSITNTIVSLGYLKSNHNFKRAFAAATVHDFFNILTVLILLPLELTSHFIERASIFLSSVLYGSVSGITYKSPIKSLINPPTKTLKSFAVETFGNDYAGLILIIISGIIIITSLSLIVKTMKFLVESNKAELINKALSQNAYSAILFGIIITIAVQSSSITTSLLIPMAGSGALSLSSIYPVTIGANIGTTATALLAALTGNVSGLAIALVHFLFNLLGALLFFPIKRMRQIPIICAETLANTIDKTKFIGFGYISFVFFVLPFSLIFIF